MNWEYRAAEAETPNALVALANRLGAERWELVHIESLDLGGVFVGFFKRQAQ